MTDQSAQWPAWLTEAMQVLPQQAEPQSASASVDSQWELPSNPQRFLDAGISARNVALLTGKKPLEDTCSLGAARDLLRSDDAWSLTLLGHHGVGKTFAGEWLLLEAIRSKRAVNDGSLKLITPYDLFEAAHQPGSRARFQRSGILVIDDLGCESRRQQPQLNWVLFDIINYRWRNMKKTLLTSNLSAKAFLGRYGQRVTDRLKNGGRCVAVTGPNLRR
jgi:DNA replication protein DnaC